MYILLRNDCRSVPPTGQGVTTEIPPNEQWLSYGHGNLPTRQSNAEDYTGTKKKIKKNKNGVCVKEVSKLEVGRALSA